MRLCEALVSILTVASFLPMYVNQFLLIIVACHECGKNGFCNSHAVSFINNEIELFVDNWSGYSLNIC